jgi:hypothetical protein
MPFLQPLEQDARIVQAQPDARVSRKRLKERRVSFLTGFFDDVVKVADRLMGMDNQSKRDFAQRAIPWGGTGSDPQRSQADFASV